MKKKKIMSVREDCRKNYKKYKKTVFNLYKNGNSLGKVCRETGLDISSVIFVLRKCKIPKNKLYFIYETQICKTNTEDKLFLESEKTYIEKFFPSSDSSYFSTSFVYFWKEKYKKINRDRESCKHKIRNITCASCGKLLADASNIQIDHLLDN